MQIRHMWEAGEPDSTKEGAGFPILENTKHTLVYAGTREAGAYNHHSQLKFHNGVFHATWSNHPHGEDGPGQRVLYSYSTDAENWSSAVEAFAPPQKVLPSEEKGLVFTALRQVVAGNKLYALAMLHENVGFESFDGRKRSDVRDKEHPSRARRGYTPLAREIIAPGEFGPIMPLKPELPEEGRLDVPVEPWDGEKTRGILDAMQNPDNIPAWKPPTFEIPKGINSPRLCEPTVYRASDGKYVILLRDTGYSHRMYVSISDSTGEWETAVPTDIPDSPSLTTSLNLNDGTVLLTGNQMAKKLDHPEEGHYNRDPLMVSVSNNGYIFKKAFALRCGRQKWRTPQSEVRGRGGGGQYPSAMVKDGILYVQYTMGKEDVWVSRVALADIIG
ncbi:MAG: exo-alpha-sialidase [Kiritimatiellia bacterium]